MTTTPNTTPVSKRPRRRLPVFARYLLLELPGWFVAALVLTVLVRHWDLSPGTALLLFGLWVAKDFALYPVLRIAYEDGPSHGTDDLVGSVGTVRERLDPTGWVRVGSELWRAEIAAGEAPLEPGATVRVLAVEDFTLRVGPG